MQLEEQDDNVKKRQQEPDDSSSTSKLRTESDLARRENMSNSRSSSENTTRIPALSLEEQKSGSKSPDAQGQKSTDVARPTVNRVSNDDASADMFFAPKKDTNANKPIPQAELPPSIKNEYNNPSKSTIKEYLDNRPEISPVKPTIERKDSTSPESQGRGTFGAVVDTMTRTTAGMGASLIHEMNDSNAKIATQTAMSAQKEIQSLGSESKNLDSFTNQKQLEKIQSSSSALANMLSSRENTAPPLEKAAAAAGSIAELAHVKPDMQNAAIKSSDFLNRADSSPMKGELARVEGFNPAKNLDGLQKGESLNPFTQKTDLGQKMESINNQRLDNGAAHLGDIANGALPRVEKSSSESIAKAAEAGSHLADAGNKNSILEAMRSNDPKISDQIQRQAAEQNPRVAEPGSKNSAPDARTNVPDNGIKSPIDNPKSIQNDTSGIRNSLPPENNSRTSNPETVSRLQNELGSKTVGENPSKSVTAPSEQIRTTPEVVNKGSTDGTRVNSPENGTKVSSPDNGTKAALDNSQKGGIPQQVSRPETAAKTEVPGHSDSAGKLIADTKGSGDQKSVAMTSKDAAAGGKVEQGTANIAGKLDAAKVELSVKGDPSAIKLDATAASKAAMANGSELHAAVQNSISKLDGKPLPGTVSETAKVVLQGKVESQVPTTTGARETAAGSKDIASGLKDNSVGAKDIAAGKNIATEIGTTRSTIQNALTNKIDDHLAAGKNQLTQLDGKNIANLSGNRNAADSILAGAKTQASIMNTAGKELGATNRADINGRNDASAAQKGSIIGNAAIVGGRAIGNVNGAAGDSALGAKGAARAIRSEGGRYLTGVEIGLLIAAVGIAKARNDARAAKPGEAGAKEFNTHKGFLTEKGSRITELTANVRRFPGKEITLSAMLAITGAAGKQNDQTQGIIGRSLDFNVRIERSIGNQPAKTSKEDLIAAALFQQKESDPPAEVTDKKKQEEDDNLDTQLLGLLPSPALFRGRRKESEQTEEKEDIVNTDDTLDLTNTPSAYRRVVKIKSEESLVSIAEREFDDASLAWLIADINFEQTTQHEVEGKRVVEVVKGQDIHLPLESEIAEFYNRRDGHVDPDNLVTIVVENEINRDKLDNDLKDILGLAR